MAEAETQTETNTETEDKTEVETKVETNTETETKAEVKPEIKPERSVLTLKKPATDETKTETESKAEEKFDPAKFKMPDKFKGKTAEEIAFSTMQLEKKLGEKVQGAVTVPETYVFDGLKEHGLEIADEAHGSEVSTMLKEVGLSQEQLAKALPHWKKQQERTASAAAKIGYEQAVRDEFGGLPNLEAEQAKLQTKWGADFESNFGKVKDLYAKNPDLFDKPLKWHAQGYEIALELANRELGADFMTSHESGGGADLIELRAELAEITSEQRRVQRGPQAALLEKRATEVAKKIAAAKR